MRTLGSLFLVISAIALVPTAAIAQEPASWEPTLEGAQQLAGQTNRLVLVYFSGPACPHCRRMEAEVFSQPAVTSALAADFVLVKVNPDFFPATARRYGITALPTTVVVTPQGDLIESLPKRREAADYCTQLSRIAAGFRQRGAVARTQAAPAATPPQQPLAAAMPAQPATLVPSVGQPPATTASRPAPVQPPPSDDRYADFFRQNRAGPTAPIAQPATVPPQTANPQPPMNYAPPTQAAAPFAAAQPPAAVGQSYPPSQPTTPLAGNVPPMQTPAPATPTMPYVTQAPAQTPLPAQAAMPPAMNAPMNQPMANPTAATLGAAPVTQAPSVNPPLCLDGYCPVALVERQVWLLGDRRWGVIHRDRTYLFSGPEEKQRFFSDPDRYAPAISGNDVVMAAEQGQTVPGMREHGVFFSGRIYLFANEANLEKFERAPRDYANKATEIATRTGMYSNSMIR